MGVCFYSIVRGRINATWSNYDFAAKLAELTHLHVFESPTPTYQARLDRYDHFIEGDSVS